VFDPSTDPKPLAGAVSLYIRTGGLLILYSLLPRLRRSRSRCIGRGRWSLLNCVLGLFRAKSSDGFTCTLLELQQNCGRNCHSLIPFNLIVLSYLNCRRCNKVAPIFRILFVYKLRVFFLLLHICFCDTSYSSLSSSLHSQTQVECI